MEARFKIGCRLRVLLPLIMTGVQLGLFAASLIVPREPWVLPVAPGSHAQSQSECGENCVSFYPPPEPNLGRIVKAAMLLNLPAVFLGAILGIAASFLHVPNGEPSLLGCSAVFVPVIWYRVGKWLDDQSMLENLHQSTQVSLKAVWTIVARAIIWFLFVMMLLALLFERHRNYGATEFMIVIWILWSGAYLGGGLWVDRRRSARRRAAVG
jgi:hypothetical protein